MLEDIVPQTVTVHLPFSAEPLSMWSEATDVFQFIRALYGHSITVIDPSGDSLTSNLEFYARDLYDWGQKTLANWVQRFATPAPEIDVKKYSYGQTIHVPNLSEDSAFGKAAKYLLAWDCVVGALLEESAFYSIAHTLESLDDLNCSVQLAADLYYKQAFQILRNYLEDLVLPMHFCDRPEEFAAWKANNYRVPPMRGRNGMVRGLVERAVVGQPTADELSALYDELNGSIHGSEKRLTHRGVFSGALESSGHGFKASELREWCECLSRAVDLGIRLQRAHLVQWQSIVMPKLERLREQGKTLCDVCHNDTDFDIEDLDIEWASEPELKLVQYKCRVCGSVRVLSRQSTT